jgi:2-keto-4-pentenoate hydratase/2-oxohepta-3-ene-1,7-dioic acid hydratase in catechol pathway
LEEVEVKLATFLHDGEERIGVVHSDSKGVFDLREAARRNGNNDQLFRSMLSLIDADKLGLDTARDVIARRSSESDLSYKFADIELLPPLPRPRQMRDCMSYATHIRQSARGARALIAAAQGEAALSKILSAPLEELPSIYKQMPIYYITNRLVVRGPNAKIFWPRYSRVMDYELEIGIITKRSRANIPETEAHDHIFGYTIFNDFSARDKQIVEMEGRLGPAKGKSFDGANVLGPWIVTADEITNAQELGVEVRVNGETRATGSTGNMLFSFEQILAYASQDETVHAGEFFGSGTIGNCCGLETGRFLEDGDLIELEIEQIGVLKNTVLRQR